MQDRPGAEGISARSILAYPVPYLGTLGMPWLVLHTDLGWWMALPPAVRAPVLFVAIVLILVAFQLGSDVWYRLADPHGLGRKSHGPGDIYEFLAATGPMAMAIAWLLHAHELPAVWLGLTLPAAPLWYAILAGLAARHAGSASAGHARHP